MVGQGSYNVPTTLNMEFSVIWYFMSPWMMDEFIDWPKPYLLLAATYGEILTWMIEMWMRIGK